MLCDDLEGLGGELGGGWKREGIICILTANLHCSTQYHKAMILQLKIK